MFEAARRGTEPEWMDGDTADAATMAACLRDLAAVNTVTLARLPTLGFVARAVRRAGGRPVSVLDVGCGEGDMLRRLHRWSERTGHPLQLTGMDLDGRCIAAARAATPAATPIEYRVADALEPALGRFDVVLSSLFTHHLPDADIVRFLRSMEDRARIGWFVNDLHRHRLAFDGFRLLSAVAGWHPMVRHDGPVSVARSFRRRDWGALLARAGVPGAVRWHLPFRFCVSRLR